MGNTCASVHISLTGTTADDIEGIVRAYKTLGFEQAQTAAPAGSKHGILLRKAGDAVVSVDDRVNAALESREVKDRARASVNLVETADNCASLYDGHTFAVVVFNTGKLVDLAMTGPEQDGGPFKVLAGA